MKKRLFPVMAFMATAVPAFAAENTFVDSILEYLPRWTMEPYFNLSLWQWIGLAGAIIVGLIIRKVVSLLVKGLHKIVSARTKTDWDDMIIEAFMGPTGTMAAVGIWFLSISLLQLDKGTAEVLGKLLQIIASIALIILAYRLTNVFIEFLHSLTDKTQSDLDDQLMPVVDKTLRFLVVTFGALIALQNLGVNVLSALAGLGIGGLAFALAARDTAANMFGSFTIFMDKPFKMGDWIKVAETHEGIVESIGIRTTRLRTFAKTLISLPNSVVANTSIENISERPYRRVYTTIGITYGSTSDQIEKLIEKIREIIRENSFAMEEDMYVGFVDYGASSLDIMVYFFVKVASWTDEILAKQQVYLAIMKAVEDLGLEFAFPTQTIHVESAARE